MGMLNKAQLYYQYAKNTISLKKHEKTLKIKQQQTRNTRLACKTEGKYLTVKESPTESTVAFKTEGFSLTLVSFVSNPLTLSQFILRKKEDLYCSERTKEAAVGMLH